MATPPSPSLNACLDHHSRAATARLTGGISPIAQAEIWADWLMHLSAAPGHQLALWERAMQAGWDMSRYVWQHPFGDDTPRKDRRFRHAAWQKAPFNYYRQAFETTQDWWDLATSHIGGMRPETTRAVRFAAHQMLDAMAPGNFIATNPEVIERTAAEKGANLLRGAEHFWQDMTQPAGLDPDYRPGETLAVTPGKVVFRNHLIELIHYTPTTETVHPEPILITPAWIMKYYILDLSPENSMVKYLVDQGHSVFMISWRNPGAEDRDLSLQDYQDLGVMAALDFISGMGAQKIHAAGYCLGGTLLSLAAATMARAQDERLASITLFTTQLDFTQAGEMMLFINDSQVAYLEDMMKETGYLDANQMVGAFQALRANDLIWARMQHEYLLGERAHGNDLMAWNRDTTRMPARMHAQYLRELFLGNAFAEGRYMVDGHPISPRDITAPIFAVGTESDHVAPWTSAFKVERLTRSDVTFILTNGGHNAGVVSEPNHPRRHYHIHTDDHRDPTLSPEDWRAQATRVEGSWWPQWGQWLAAHSGEKTAPLSMPEALCDAPGTYIHQR